MGPILRVITPWTTHLSQKNIARRVSRWQQCVRLDRLGIRPGSFLLEVPIGQYVWLMEQKKAFLVHYIPCLTKILTTFAYLSCP